MYYPDGNAEALRTWEARQEAAEKRKQECREQVLREVSYRRHDGANRWDALLDELGNSPSIRYLIGEAMASAASDREHEATTYLLAVIHLLERDEADAIVAARQGIDW